jgi:type IV pilus assembly protein PilC
MRKHPRAFNKLFTSMIAAGEAGGILDIILQRLSTYIEKVVRLQAQVRSALIYPVTVLVIAFGVVYIILWKVIPVFAQLFAGLGAELPYLTRRHRAASTSSAATALDHLGLWLLYVAIRRYHKTERAGGSSTASSSSCRSSACWCARSPWRASAARCRP